MGTHPIFGSDFDCLTESEMDDEFAKFMSEVNDTPALVAPEPAPAGPRKRGLPAAYANRTNMFSSLKPKVQKIELDPATIPQDTYLANATISAAPTKNEWVAPFMRKTDDTGPRKIGLEKVNVTPFFGNEKQAFSLKKEAAVESAPKSYAIKQEEIKQERIQHMSDKDLKAKLEMQPTSAFSMGPKNPDDKKSKVKKEKNDKTNESGQKPAFVGMDKKLEARGKKFIRCAAGEKWDDPTLGEWDAADYRIFAGDLGNEVTDDVLSRAFNKYPSFLKAKVIREKGPKMGKSKGYGFISFRDPEDFIKAMREMNGKYVGNRPIKLRKSSWKDRQVEVVKKKNKEKKKLGYRV